MIILTVRIKEVDGEVFTSLVQADLSNITDKEVDTMADDFEPLFDSHESE